ncbi:hypothetical protein LUZ60_009620 [Juncus effusus]|nr:hypothetical protein LUZ60_009620 [Juncus effusus]
MYPFPCRGEVMNQGSLVPDRNTDPNLRSFNLHASLPTFPPLRYSSSCLRSTDQIGAFSSQLERPSNNPWPRDHEEEISFNTKRLLPDCETRHNNFSAASLSIGATRMKKKARRKVREPRFCFKTLSEVDVLDDGYKWRKYGQKIVKNTQHPRSYYRCTQDNCRVKKRIERLAEDPRMVITTYEGRHVHSPSHDEEEPQASTQMNFFW